MGSYVPCAYAGADPSDATSALQDVPDFAAGLLPASQLPSKPLEGKRIGVVRQAMGEGVEAGVHDAVTAAVTHLEALGAHVEEVSLAEEGDSIWMGEGGGVMQQ